MGAPGGGGGDGAADDDVDKDEGGRGEEVVAGAEAREAERVPPDAAWQAEVLLDALAAAEEAAAALGLPLAPLEALRTAFHARFPAAALAALPRHAAEHAGDLAEQQHQPPGPQHLLPDGLFTATPASVATEH